MQDKQLFEYAVIRVVPRVEREEFINVGVILFSNRKKYLACKLHFDAAKIQTLSIEADLEEIEKNLESFSKIADGTKDSGPIGQLIPAERFRWLTATRSTVVQCSKVHPGFCLDPAQSLDRLFKELVL